MGRQEWFNLIIGTLVALNTLALVSRARQVKRNNAIVRDEYEDLARWAHDEHQAEATALEAAREQLAARGMLDSGQAGFEDRRIRDEFARRWRNRRSQSERAIRNAELSEGFVESAWRFVTRTSWPSDPSAEQTAILTRGWDERVV